MLRQKGILISRWQFMRWNVFPLLAMVAASFGVLVAEAAVIGKAGLV